MCLGMMTFVLIMMMIVMMVVVVLVVAILRLRGGYCCFDQLAERSFFSALSSLSFLLRLALMCLWLVVVVALTTNQSLS